MRKELGGILLFFLVILTMVSLLTYSPGDSAINHAGGSGQAHNFFGPLGANTASMLLFMFGLGAFWLPVLMLLAGVRLLGDYPVKIVLPIIFGGLLLMIASGGLFAFFDEESFSLFGRAYPSGGIAGLGLMSLFTYITGRPGGFIVLFLLFLTGLIVATSFSPVKFGKRCWQIILILIDRFQTLYLKRKEQKIKAEKRAETVKRQAATPPTPKVAINAPTIKPVKPAPRPKQEEFSFMAPKGGAFTLPSVKLLDDTEDEADGVDDDSLQMLSRLLEKKLEDFGVSGRVTAVSPGPVVTTFEYEPAPGVKINRIVSLADDLALALRAISIRIAGQIPGKAAIGIEIPNMERELVRIKEIIVSPIFGKLKSKLSLCLGKDIVGQPVAVEMDKMPHLLVAGSTGSGKSVALNTMICSLLYKATPDEVKLLMIDPKRIELSLYDGIPHLIAPVVTDMKKATNALAWAVREMEERYQKLSEKRVRNIGQYNKKLDKEAKEGRPKAKPPEGASEGLGDGAPDPAEDPDRHQKLPYIVIIIDEFADLMMVASRDVEAALTRLAQMARAAGIHLILATQRPSVNVLTGVIKANFPTRISFQVSSKTDSRTILDGNGAESLLGNGDMLFLPPGAAKLQRIHGAYISEEEVSRIIGYLKQQKKPDFDERVTEAPPKPETEDGDTEYDERYDEAVALVAKSRQASISMIQRHLRIGYNRAARIIEVMEQEGVVGPSDGVKPREVLIADFNDQEK